MYTWEGRGSKSVIDYALVTTSLYNKYHDMQIDEDKEIYDLSDHNLINIRLKLNGKIRQKDEPREVEDYKKDEENLKIFIRELEEKCSSEENMSIEKLREIMQGTADKKLKRKYKRREKQDNSDPSWITDEIKKGIALRKKYNRTRRNAKKNEQEQEKWKYEYQKQKKIVQD